MREVLAALDGSPRASAVLALALDMGERFGARVDLLRVISVPQEFPAAAANAGDPLPEILRRQASEQLAALAAADPRGAGCRLLVRTAHDAWRAILEAADELDADLIVLGSHGYGGLDRVLGTTAGHVANQARRNVLVVHEGAR